MTPLLTTPETPPPLTPRDRILWEAIRHALLMMLAAVERYLDMERSRETREERRAREFAGIDRH